MSLEEEASRRTEALLLDMGRFGFVKVVVEVVVLVEVLAVVEVPALVELVVALVEALALRCKATSDAWVKGIGCVEEKWLGPATVLEKEIMSEEATVSETKELQNFVRSKQMSEET